MQEILRTARRTVAVAAALAALSAVALTTTHAQAAPAAPAATALKVGDMAPDFTVPWVTAAGLESKPFKLSEHRGETIILAFFPKARTQGCTMQMHAYRDRYSELFKDGKKITLIGVSIDPDSALTSWAKDDGFKFHFASDVDRKVGMAFGANMGTGNHKRHLYVIDPKGKISYIAVPFLQAADEAYVNLGAAVTQSAGGH